MTGEQFISECWNCRDIRQYIINRAKERSKSKESQEDFCQEAWLCISTLPECCGIEQCKQLASKAIYSSYWQLNKERLMQRSPSGTCLSNICGDEYEEEYSERDYFIAVDKHYELISGKVVKNKKWR